MILLPLGSLGFIARIYSLQEVLDASKVICVGQVESVDAARMLAVATISETLKGENRYPKIQMNIGVGQGKFPAYLIKALKPGSPIIFFYDLNNGKIACCAHSSDVWFQFFADDNADKTKVWWNFSHVEIYMNRTFAGTTVGLIALVKDVLAGRTKPPAPDASVPPLDVTKSETAASSVSRSSLPMEGIEALSGWEGENWGSPTGVSVRDMAGGNGKVLQIGCKPTGDGKIAVSKLVEIDAAEKPVATLDAYNDSGKPLAIALAVSTMPGWVYYESPPIPLPPGAWQRAITFDLTSPSFKAEHSRWQFNSTPGKLDKIAKLTVLLYDVRGNGALLVDNFHFLPGGFYRCLELPANGGEGRGVSWADYDSDGDLDAFVCHGSGGRLYRNDSGTFTDVTAEAGVGRGSRSASWADYNGDGKPDLFLSTPALYTNIGGKFRDDTALLPRLAKYNTEGAGWLDYDGDGLPDILLTNGEYGIALFKNLGKVPWFEDASSAAGFGPGGMGTSNGDFVTFTDLDLDGFQDIIYNLGTGLVARNTGRGAFSEFKNNGISFATGNGRKLGTASADYDNDEDLDLFVPQRGGCKLFRNNNDGTFTEVASRSGELENLSGQSFAAAWGDLDLDGLLDLVVTNLDGPLAIFLNNGNGQLVAVSERFALPGAKLPAGITGISLGDCDNDGDLDLLLNSDEPRAYVLLNSVPRQRHCYLEVRPVGRGTLGAIVRLYDAAGKPVGVREISGATNCGSQLPPVAHFGLGEGSYKLSVLFADGNLVQQEVKVEPPGFALAVENKQ